jgi:DNA primase
MIPDPIVEEVRLRADIVETLGEHISLQRAGKDFKALCPFHHEKTPSFYVVPAKGFYKCFGCGESGDVFSFLMKHLGMGFNDAVRQVAARVGVEIPDVTARNAEEPNRQLYEAIAFAEDFFQRTLLEGPAGQVAREYLERRGVSQDALARFRIGYAPDAWRALREAAQRHGIQDDVLLAAGLIKESERSEEPYDRFRNRVIFPIAEPSDRTIAFGGRLCGRGTGNAPKYLNSPETPIYHKGRILYGLNWSKGAIRRDGGALVVEGYMDFVSLAARGIENVVAGMGTALTAEQASLVSRYAHKVYLLYDSDAAGLRATFRSADALLRAGVHPLVVTLPAGEDPDSLARAGGAEALRPQLDAAVDVLERKIQILDQHGYLHDIDGKRRALDRLLPTLRAVVDPPLRDIYMKRVAARTDVNVDTLERELAAPEGRARTLALQHGRPAGQGPRARSIASGSRVPYRARLGEAERLLVLLMARDLAWVGAAVAEVRPEELRDPVYRELFEALANASTENDDPTTTAEAESFLAEVSEPAREAFSALLRDKVEIADGERNFRDAVADIRAVPLFLRLEDIDRRLEKAADGDKALLLSERRQVNEALGALDARGFKFSPRYRHHSRASRPGKRTPSTEDV